MSNVCVTKTTETKHFSLAIDVLYSEARESIFIAYCYAMKYADIS